jgi:hypothetical protein
VRESHADFSGTMIVRCKVLKHGSKSLTACGVLCASGVI